MPNPSIKFPLNELNALILIASCTLSASAQYIEGTRYIFPMDIPVQLSGNFMELRPNHFHSGIEFLTQGREGIPAGKFGVENTKAAAKPVKKAAKKAAKKAKK